MRRTPSPSHALRALALRAVAFPVLAILALGLAFPSPAHAGKTCTWTADRRPWFPPGVSPYDEHGDNRESLGAHTWRHRRWDVMVFPGWMYADLYARDDVSLVPHFGSAMLDFAAARTAFYNVIGTSRCALPLHSVTARATCSFTTRVQTNSPAEAQVAGLTTIKGTLTGMFLAAGGGCECGMSRPGDPTQVTFRLRIGGQEVTFRITLEWGEDTKTDAVSASATAAAAVWDEEYVLTHDLSARAKAAASLIDWFADASALLAEHSIWIETRCRCDGECGASKRSELLVDSASVGFTTR